MGRIVLALGILLVATNAHAVSQHSDAKAVPVRGGKSWKLMLRLKDYDGSRVVRVGIISRGRANTNLTRRQARHLSEGVLLHQFPPITEGLSREATIEVELKAPFNDKLKPGARLSVVTAWGKNEDNPHVYGGVMSTAGAGSFITLPKPKPPGTKSTPAKKAPAKKTTAKSTD